MLGKIAFIGQPEYFRFTYEHDLDDLAEVREFPANFLMKAENYADLVEYQAKFNLFFRGEFVPTDILGKLNGIKIALSSEPFPRIIGGKTRYTLDSLLRYCVFRQIRLKPFDYIFHYDAASLPILKRDGLDISGAFALPVATDTYRFERAEHKWDIFFIGRSTPYRETFFTPLKHQYNFLHICHGMWGCDLVHYMNRSRICLNIHAENEISWEPRVQMMLAAQAFLISEKLAPNEYIRPGLDYVEVANPREAIEAVKYYIGHETERIKIATSGCNRVRDVLDSRRNFDLLFKRIGSGEINKFHAGNGTLKYDLCGRLIHIIAKMHRLSGFLRA